MPRLSRPRKGSLQFYPRKRAAKQIPSANWKPVTSAISEEGLLGFIGYNVETKCQKLYKIKVSKKYCPRFGQIAIEQGYITAEELKCALSLQVDDDIAGRDHRLLKQWGQINLILISLRMFYSAFIETSERYFGMY